MRALTMAWALTFRRRMPNRSAMRTWAPLTMACTYSPMKRETISSITSRTMMKKTPITMP